MGQGIVAAGIEVAVLLPDIRVASVSDLSQDLSAPDPVLSCSMQWAGPGYSCWETNWCVLLPRACLPEIQHLAAAPSCGAALWGI